ncbi:MAG: hypothetical protein AB7P40_02670 [Chloroflexota bacterium]
MSLLGYITEINEPLEVQSHINDYRDQFDIEPERYLLVLGGLLVIFVVGSVLALKSKDVHE